MTIIFDGTQGITTPAETANNSVTTPVVKSGSSLVFQTNGTTEAMRIDTSGNILNGVTSIGSALPGMYIQNNQATGTGYNIINTNTSGNAGLFLGSAFSGGTYGNVQWNGSAVATGPYAYNNPNVLCVLAGGSNNLQIGAGGAVKFYSGSLNTVTLDSSGRMTMTSQPSFRALKSTDTVGSSQNPIQFDSIQYNIGGHYNSSTYRFTAPVAGRYLISVLASFYSQNDARQVEVQIRVNGNAVHVSDCFMQITQGNNTHTNVSLTTILNLAENDYVTGVWASSTNTVTFYSAGSRIAFSGCLLN